MSFGRHADPDLGCALRLSFHRPNRFAAAVSLLLLAISAGCGFAGTPAGLNSTGESSGSGSTGPAKGALTANTTNMVFGNVTVGMSSSQPIVLTNSGAANVSISSVSISGNGFTASGAAGAILSPNQSVTVHARFSPSVPGTVQGSLSVSSNASNALVGQSFWHGSRGDYPTRSESVVGAQHIRCDWLLHLPQRSPRLCAAEAQCDAQFIDVFCG